MRATAALALTAANEKQIVGLFRAKRAVNIAAARSLNELGLNDSQSLRKMVGSAVIRRAGPERYFLDEKMWAGRRQLGGKTTVRVVVAVIFIAVAIALYFYGR